nr:hypothetical protein CFP56_38188 [Quercus suber]
MEDDADSDDEVAGLREGLAAVKLTKETKIRIRGEAIGKVLRIDTHTALESQEKYARLCIQVDVEKPLINTILIGKFEQEVAYEGINKLCFSCGRIGHKKENCTYKVRRAESSPEKEVPSLKENSASSRSLHETAWTKARSGIAESSGAKPNEDLYGPWMVVTHRKAGQRGTRKGNVGNQGPTGDTILNEARPGVAKLGPNVNFRGETGKNSFNLEAHCSPSVKGKKLIVRNTVATTSNKEAARSNKPPFNFTSQTPTILSRDGTKHDPSIPFLFSTTTSVEMGNQHQQKSCGNVRSDDSRNRGEADTCDGVVRSTVEESLESNHSSNGRKCEGRLSINPGLDMGIDAEPVVGASDRRSDIGGRKENGAKGNTTTFECSNIVRGRPNGGDAKKDMMEFEEGGGATTFP